MHNISSILPLDQPVCSFKEGFQPTVPLFGVELFRVELTRLRLILRGHRRLALLERRNLLGF